MFSLLLGLLLSLVFLILARYKVRPLAIICAICIFALVAFNSQSNDRERYEEIFQSQASPYVEYGFQQLIYILKFLGATSHSAVLAFYGVALLITLIYLHKKIKYATFFMLVYFIFLLPLDITQTRFGIASLLLLDSIILFSFFRANLAWLFLSLAPLFHIFTGLLALPIAVSRFHFFSKYYHFVFVFLFLSSIMFPAFISLAIPSLRTFSSYLHEGGKYFSFFSWVIPISLCLIILKYFRNRIIRPLTLLDSLYRNCIAISIMSLSFAPGLLYITDFHRVYRFTFLLITLSTSVLLGHLSYSARLLLSSVVLAIALCFGLYYNQYANYDFVYWGISP